MCAWRRSCGERIELDRLPKHGSPWPDQLFRYPGAGHVVTVPYQPVPPLLFSYRGQEMGMYPFGNAIANGNSWPAILPMLASRFGPL